MNTYEALVIFKPTVDGENNEGVVRSVENTLRHLKGKVLNMDKAGRKRLAYDMDGVKDGFFATYVFQLPPASLQAFKNACKHQEDIVRMTVIRLEHVEPAQLSSMVNTVTARELKEREHAGGRGPQRGRFGGGRFPNRGPAGAPGEAPIGQGDRHAPPGAPRFADREGAPPPRRPESSDAPA